MDLIDNKSAKIYELNQKVVRPNFSINSRKNYSKKIVIVSDTWLPDTNGVVTTLNNVAMELTKLNFQVEFITPDKFPTVSSSLYPEIRLAIETQKIEEMLNHMNPDALYIATEGPLGFAARKYAQDNKFPYATGYHTRFPMYLKKYLFIPEIFTYWLMQWFHNQSSVMLVPTKSLARQLRLKGFNNAKVWTRGVDESRFFITSSDKKDELLDDSYERPIYLNVGRIAAEKNLDAFLDINIKGTKIIVGKGPDEERLKNKYKQQINQKKIVFMGEKKDFNLAKIYSASDVFVFPSRTDTFGLVMLEALASGLLVAAYPVTGPLDVVGDGCKCGFLNKDLKKSITEATMALNIKKITPQECREYAIKNYTWRRTAELFAGYMVFVDKPIASMGYAETSKSA